LANAIIRNFNLGADIQKYYIKQIAKDLGCDFAVRREGGFGGDVEMFCTKGENVTNWHFDGQDNFTIQLKGTKRWSIVGGVECPLTNCNMIHPDNSDFNKYEVQKMCHSSYDASPIPPDIDPSKVKTFVLRPGSIMYFPAGYWHHVVVDSDEGALSMNFALYPSTWLDVLQKSLVQHLWKFKHWRQAVVVQSASQAQRHLEGLLSNLPQEIAQLTSELILPKGKFLGHREKQIIISESLQNEKMEIEEHHIFAKSPIGVLLRDKEEEYRWYEQENERLHQREIAEHHSLQRLNHFLQTDHLPQSTALPQSQHHKRKFAKSFREKEVGKSTVNYTLYLSFGDAMTLEPDLEVKLIVQEELVGVVEWIKERKNPFTLKELLENTNYNSPTPSQKKRKTQPNDEHTQKEEMETKKGKEKEEELSEGVGEVEKLLRTLCFNGYLHKLNQSIVPN